MPDELIDTSAFQEGAGIQAVPEENVPAAEAQPSREEQQQADVDAFKAAVEEVSEKPATEVVKDETNPAAEVKPDTVAKPETPAPAPPDATDPKVAEKAAVDADLAKLNADLKADGHKPLSKAAEEQFRKLASRPTPEAVEQIVAPLRQQAERMARWDEIVAQTKATGGQLDTAMQYIAAYNSGDPKLMGQAADLMFKEVAGMFKALGRELPGAVDPLEGHADLTDAVERGDITRKFALETAQARALQARAGEQSQRQTEEAEYQRAETEARGRLNQLGASLHQADPAQYVAKYASLVPAMELIKSKFHPSEWEAQVFHLYQRLPYTPASVSPPPAPKPPVGSVPIRPTGGNGAALRAAVPQDPVKAFMHGVESVRG